MDPSPYLVIKELPSLAPAGSRPTHQGMWYQSGFGILG